MKKQGLRYLVWALCVTLWTTLCFIVPYFLDSPAEGFFGVLAMTAYVAACGIGSFFLLYLIGCNRYVCAVLLPLFALVGAALSFYLVGYHTTLTPMLIEVTLHTNAEEAFGVISRQAVLWVALNIGIAALFVWWRMTKIVLSHAWLHGLAALLLGTLYFGCNDRLKDSLCQRYPYNVPHTIREYLSLRHATQAERSVPAYTIVEAPDSLTVVLVIGEAVRTDHLQLNGYERETTPRLSARTNIISYPHIYSEATHTLASIPYIITRADSAHTERQYTEHSFVRIFNEAGFSSAWITNQEVGRTFAPFVNECDTLICANAGKSVYVFTQWMDAEMLPHLRRLQQHFPSPRQLYILHAIGSHWYFNNHVPEREQVFQPVTTNKVITANTPEQIINSYDNTVRYMDLFVDSVIGSLEQEKAIVLYQSDHGEALGEEGYYLHANEAEPVHHPACVIWYSDKYAAAYPDKIKALVANKDKRYRTDYLYHSILSAAGIEAEGESLEINIFR